MSGVVELVGVAPRSEAGMVFTIPQPTWDALTEVIDDCLLPNRLDDLLCVGECVSGVAGFGSHDLLVRLGEGVERLKADGSLGLIADRHGVSGQELACETLRLMRFLRACGGVVVREPSRGV